MEILVSGWMPRAGLLLLPLLLCFGPETAVSINLDALSVIVDYVIKYGFDFEYAFALSLDRIHCQGSINQSALEQVLKRTELAKMQAAINQKGGLYDTVPGNIVAAVAKDLPSTSKEQHIKPQEHAEWRLLKGGQNSPVQKLLAQPSKKNSCLIFFTLKSPCVRKCLLVNGNFSILRPLRDIFSRIDNNYKAFVFQQIYNMDWNNVKHDSLLKAWHQLQNVPLYRCQNNICKDCSGNDTNTNPCMKWKLAKEQPLHPPSRG